MDNSDVGYCSSCQFDALDGSEQPCSNCLKDYFTDNGATGWTAIEEKKGE